MERKEWLEWRKKGIGSSDAPIIMGVSPWKTPLQLWEEKVSEEEVVETSSYITDLGNLFEPKIRSLYELMTGKVFDVGLAVRQDFPFIRASLDGALPDMSEIIEIKLSGKDDYEGALKGIVPEKYMPQIQHQLMVTGAKVCHYLSYKYERGSKTAEINRLAIVAVYPDLAYQEKLFIEEQKFWDHVTSKKPIQESSRDYKILNGVDDFAERYSELKKKLEIIESEMEEVKQKIINAAKDGKHTKYEVGKLKVSQVAKSGSVDYAKIPELKNVDLDKYRKKGTTYWKITEASEED